MRVQAQGQVCLPAPYDANGNVKGDGGARSGPAGGNALSVLPSLGPLGLHPDCG